MAIPISKIGGKDRIVWPHNKNGEYTVKNGYCMLKKIGGETRSINLLVLMKLRKQYGRRFGKCQ